MKGDDAQVVIVGGGPIGLACALLLARRDIRSRVIDARTLEQARADPRLLALSAGTWQVLGPLLGATSLRRAPIREVFVSSAGEFGTAHLSSKDLSGTELGATVLYGDLVVALDAAVAQEPRIDLLRTRRVRSLSQAPDAVAIELDDGRALNAPLVIEAEGTGVPMPTGGEMRTAIASSGQSSAGDECAVLANVRLQRPAHALAASAFERFTREGPLALLPTPVTSASAGEPGEPFALVWCCDEAQAMRRCAIDDETFAHELGAAIGPRIGRVIGVAARLRMALQQRVRAQIVSHRVVALGNAAQALHPVAGQGFNLGLRDCATLAQYLDDETDLLRALDGYAVARRTDRGAIAALTGWLPDLFATRFAPLAAARSLALTALGLTPAARRELTHLLMFGIRA